jgi:glycosyltransferase involved in cell wall biosynthesis
LRHQARRTVGLAVLEATKPLTSFDFSTADRWQVLVLVDGTPAARIETPSPGPVDSAALARALFLRHGDDALRRRALAERLAERLGAARPERARAAPRVSVVVCTHGRPEYLPTVLAALAALDPPAHEIVVVDNAPGERDCRAAVDAIRARYVREDTKGLDHARNAGLRAATGEIVAFTDDDCVPPAGWIGALQRAFADELISAVTGPAFPYLLDTPARVRMEKQASLTRGLRRRVYDWTVLAPVHGSQVGVGANMAFRRSVLDRFEAPFPGELDAGTLTRSGGDSYLFARLLADGQRIAYEPAAYVFHQHRPDWERLVDAVVGYGTGAAAMASKLLVEDRELESPRVWAWLVEQYLRTQARRLTGRADAVETRIAWSYLRGGLAGAQAWRRALAADRLNASPPTGSAASAGDAAPSAGVAARRERAVEEGSGDVALSVVVPTVGRPEALSRCLDALSRQTLEASAFEVVVCDDTPRDGAARRLSPPVHGDLAPTVVETGGVGAAAARNAGAARAAGRILLFLDDDLVPSPDLVARHVAAHRDLDGAAVVGHSPPRPGAPGLAASGASLWWDEHFAALSASDTLGFTDMLSGNMSIGRTLFLAVGGFDAAFGRDRREDWELGLRLRRQGIPIVYEARARAAHEFRLDAAARLRAAQAEGRGDARLVSLEPATGAYLPLARHRPPTWRRPVRAAAFQVLASSWARPAVLAALGLLESVRLRSSWSRLYNRAQRAAYARGLRQGGWRAATVEPPPSLPLELNSRARIKAPSSPIPPRLALLADGEPCGEVSLPDGRWQASIADRIADEVPAQVLGRLVEQPEQKRAGKRARGGEGLVTIAQEGATRGALRAGVEAISAPHDAAGFWSVVDERLGRADWELLAIVLPGRCVTADGLSRATVAFEGPSVGAMVARALPDTAVSEPLSLAERRRGRLPFAPLGPSADLVVLRREALSERRPELADLAAVNDMVAVGWLVESAIESSWLVAHGGVRGVEVGADRAPARSDDKLVAWSALNVGSGRVSLLDPRLLVAVALVAARRALRRKGRRGRAAALPVVRGAVAGRRLVRTAPLLRWAADRTERG